MYFFQVQLAAIMYNNYVVTSNFGLDLRAYMYNICLCWASNLRLQTLYTSHEHVSCTKTLSQHRRMNLQHSLNVSLARFHKSQNKPAVTHGLTPTPAYFDIVPAIQSEPRTKQTCSFTFVDVGNALTIFASTQSACAQARFRCMNNRKKISFIHVRINQSM